MTLPLTMAPPADVVKANVAATGVLPATLSPPATANDVRDTAPPTAPEDTAFEGNTSALVCTVMLPPAVGELRKVKPESVTVTAVLALRVAPEVVMTMELMPGAPREPREAPPDTAPVGVTVVAKKLTG